jgi:hypothetical protein
VEPENDGLPAFLNLGSTEDFLSGADSDDARTQTADAALAFAQSHMFFITDPRAAKLLQFWKDTVVSTRIPVGSPIDAYAAAEAIRAFVGQIDRQIEMAKKGSVS